jgi:hypothetical protein
MIGESVLVKETEITALMQILRESGIKGVMEYADCIVLNHLIERGQIGHDRSSIIQALKNNTEMNTSEIMELVNKYERLKESLPSYSLGLNMKMDKINAIQDAEVPFEWVGRRLIGLVKNGRNGYFVYDGQGNHLIKLADVNEDYQIMWNNHWQNSPAVMNWVSKKVRELKNRIW